MADEGRQRYVAPEPNAMYTLGHEKWKRAGPTPLSSTAGAVEVRDDKGNVAILLLLKRTKLTLWHLYHNFLTKIISIISAFQNIYQVRNARKL